MTAKTICFGLQKGGIGKSTSSGVTSFLLSQEGYNVLHIDCDPQASSTQMLAEVDDATEIFNGKSILEAIKAKDPFPYIYQVSPTLHLLPSTDFFATADQYLFREYKENPSLALNNVVNKVREKYDYIIIDTSPSLAITTINALCASDDVVIVTNTEKFAYNAIPRFMETIELAKTIVQSKTDRELNIIGILRGLHDARRSDNKAFSEMMEEEYGSLLFKTVISRKATIGRLPIFGFKDNSELKPAIEDYERFLKELKTRV